LRSIKPYQKLIAQLLVATIVIVNGVVLPWTPFPLVNMAITILWLVGITNAVNLLDNMDGLAAGISTVAGAFLTANLWMNGQITESIAVASFVATLLGFLIYNFNPASIFMGDCGSMFLGFFLAGTSMLSLGGGRLQSLPVLIVPVLVLLIPIFDTTLVAIVRRMSGRAISQGGRDHASHRLVALGLSERRAVVMLYGLATMSGCLGLAVRWLPMDTAIAAVAGLTIVLTIIGIYLGQMSVYDAAEVAEARRKPVVAFLIDLSYKRRVFEVLLDAALVLMSWQLASLILFGRDEPGGSWAEVGRNWFISPRC
jgi:UDP-GlcNAc:undecaprenyl-phosphate GlcNAc-1-phosphate transferase